MSLVGVEISPSCRAQESLAWGGDIVSADGNPPWSSRLRAIIHDPKVLSASVSPEGAWHTEGKEQGQDWVLWTFRVL